MKLVQWVSGPNLYRCIGLGGVREHETKRACLWNRFFTYALIIVSIALLFEWEMQAEKMITDPLRLLINWAVWIYFAVHLGWMLHVVKQPMRYLRDNWLLPVALLMGLPFLFQFQPFVNHSALLRPLFGLWLLIPVLRLLSYFFLDGRLLTTVLAAGIIVIVFGILVAGVDPAITSAWDGIWWALATVSTVGYGDVVPVSLLGRLIGTLLVFLGLGVFVVITANFLALTLRKEAEQIEKEEQDIRRLTKELQGMEKNQQELLRLVRILNNRVARLDKEATQKSQRDL